MPKSKRNRVVALTKVKKKTREWKEGLVTTVRNYLDEYPAVYLFKYENMRNDKFKELRDRLRDSSRFVMGSNKVLRVALGKDESDEYKDNLHLISQRIHGSMGLFFTSMDHKEVVQLFEEFEEEDYARAGSRATQTFVLPAGPVLGPYGAPIAHTLEPMLRQNGLPTKLDKGVVKLVAEHTVCSEGQRLASQQVAVLRVFEVKMAVFRMRLKACWKAEGDEYEELGEDESDDESDGGGAAFEGEHDHFAPVGFKLPSGMELPAGALAVAPEDLPSDDDDGDV